MLFEFLEQLRLDDVRVRAPTKYVLLCGGQMTKINEEPPISLRDVFYKIVDGAIPSDANLLRAEDIHAFVIRDHKYDDFLIFETHLAQVCEIVLLFCESEGSFAELGTFSCIEEIRSRTLVIIEDKYFNVEQSYIRLGPLQALINDDDSAVVTFDFGNLGSPNKDFAKVDREKLKRLIRPRIDKRLLSIDRQTLFDPSRDGHAIKAVVGLCQEFGALLMDEILLALQHLAINTDENQLKRYIFCASRLNWLKEKRVGDRRLIFSNPFLAEIAAQFLLQKEGILPTNASRRRVQILEHWRQNDSERFEAITATRGAPWPA